MRTALVALPLLLPALAVAQDVNPFQPGAAARPSAAIFAPAKETRALLPPPLLAVPEPPSIAAASTSSPAPAPAATQVEQRETSRPCPITVTPALLSVGPEGGEFVLQVNEAARARGCVAGIESREPWLKIRYFNGQKLTLLAEPNSSRSARRGELIFANLADSLVIRVEQAAP